MIISPILNMPDDFEIVFFGDNQHGNIAEAEDKYLECIEYICAKPNRFGVHMGDICDAFWVDDRRYNPTTCTSPPEAQREHQIEILTPLAKTKRLLTILEGNHEWELQKKVGDFASGLCRRLQEKSKCQYPIAGTFTNKLELWTKKGSPMFKVWTTHGRKSISSISPDPQRKRAYMQFRLKRLLEDMAGDCIIMVRGHSHIVLVTSPMPTLYLTSERGKLKQHYTKAGIGTVAGFIPPEHRFFGCSGSFLKSQVVGVSTYSELGEMAPTELGYLKAIINDRVPVDLVEVKI